VLLDKTDGTAAAKEMFRANCKGMKRELGYDQSPALEHALIGHMTLRWVRLSFVEQKQIRDGEQSHAASGPVLGAATVGQSTPVPART